LIGHFFCKVLSLTHFGSGYFLNDASSLLSGLLLGLLDGDSYALIGIGLIVLGSNKYSNKNELENRKEEPGTNFIIGTAIAIAGYFMGIYFFQKTAHVENAMLFMVPSVFLFMLSLGGFIYAIQAILYLRKSRPAKEGNNITPLGVKQASAKNKILSIVFFVC